jgi:hypothetical protein
MTKTYLVTFPYGRETVAHADNESAAMSKAFNDATRPVYCRIHEGISENSNAKVGEMGLWFPPSPYPTNARLMQEIRVNGGYGMVFA